MYTAKFKSLSLIFVRNNKEGIKGFERLQTLISNDLYVL